MAKSHAHAPAAESHSLLKVHHLRPAPGSHTKKTRVGRGEGSKGKTAGARYQVPAGFEGGQLPLHMRLPKLRGFKNRFRAEFQVVNLSRVAELFPDGGAVGIPDLVRVGAVRKGELVKVLGDGDLNGMNLQITANKFSSTAREKIEAAGGSVTEI
jgi:large subunit ribosomal protein L15